MDSKILLVDDDAGMIQVMARILSGMGQLRFATSGPAALKQAREIPPDLILLDAEMPDMSGYEVCEALKADAELTDIPVIFVTGHSEQVHELKGLELGAVDFLSKPISEPLLLARVRTQLRVKQLTDELKRISTVDALTETMNRRAFDAALSRECKRAVRSSEPISLLMVDVDHFKLFNDHYGHPAGDVCLRPRLCENPLPAAAAVAYSGGPYRAQESVWHDMSKAKIGRSAFFSPSDWTTGSTRTARSVSSMSLSRNSTSRSWASTAQSQP